MNFRALVIEDHPAYSLLICQWLQEMGSVDAIHTDNGREGMILAEAGGWDLVICDLGLPEISGLSILPRLRNRSPSGKIVVFSVSTNVQDVSGAVGIADAFLPKPATKERFFEVVGLLLRNHAAQRRQNTRCVLAVGAHPDDVEIGCGGALARFRNEGARTVILTLTGGEGGGASSKRRRESAHAADVLGAELVVLDLPDRTLSAGPETIQAIHEVIERNAVTHVLTHTQHDAHQDHRNTHAATVVAARGVANLMCYQSPSTTVAFQPTYFIEISDFLTEKLNAIQAHASQTATRPYLDPEHLKATARYWGRFCGYGLAEPFDAIRLTQS